MQSLVDAEFFSDLVLQCLNYAPYLPKSEEKFVKNVRSLRLAVNIFRCDYYSYFLRLISNIPKTDCMDEKNFITQILCINLRDKNEEFLLTCSVVVQFAHFVFMESACLHSFFIAVDSLGDVYKRKYLGTFGDICRWREFERFCDTVERKRGSFRASFKAECEALHYTPGKSDIFNFWNVKEIIKLIDAAKLKEDNHGGVFDVEKIASKKTHRSAYELYLNQRLDQLEFCTTFSEDLEAVILQEIEYSCWGKHGKFCLGCVLSQSYPVVRDKGNPKLKGSQEESKKTPEIENGTKIHENENPDTVDISNNEICISTPIEEHRGPNAFERRKEISDVKPGLSRTNGDKCSFKIKRTDKTSQIVNSSPVVDDERNFRKTDRSISTRSEEESNFILKIIKNIFRCGINALKYLLLRFTSFKNIFVSIMKVFRFVMDTFGRFFGFKKHGDTGIAPTLDTAPDDPELECAFAENPSPTEPKSTGSIILRVEAGSSENVLPLKSDLAENSSPSESKSSGNIAPRVEAESSENALGSIPDETLSLGESESVKGELHQPNESSEIALNQVQKALEWTHGTIIFKKLKSKDLEVLNSIKCHLCKSCCWNTLKGETMEYKIVFGGHF